MPTPRVTVTGAATAQRRRLGEVLVDQGVLTEAELETCLAEQSDSSGGRRRLGGIVVRQGYASEAEVARALAEALELDLVDLAHTLISPEVVRTVPRQVAERCGVLLLDRRDGAITVATADPTNVVALDDVRLLTGARAVRVVVATESQVVHYLSRAWSLSEDDPDVVTLVDDVVTDIGFEDPAAAHQEAETAPIVRLVDVILSDAVHARASDIHVEPQADVVRIRYRVDGVLRQVMTVPRRTAAPLVSRLKILSGLDIAERRRPQDGRARLRVDDTAVDTRVSTMPGLLGEKVVIRLLARADVVPPLADIGLDERQLESLTTALASPQGLVLLTGPTGSGKTRTLYSAIGQIDTVERNVVTLEDPVEVQLPGITQVQVHERSGLTFARGLRSMLRQDPDVMLVGEVRDTETAELAVQASMTGHLVLTTLHTKDTFSAVSRLVNMGIEPFLVASSLSLVVAQRLVRRPCESCMEPTTPDPRMITALGLVDDDVRHATTFSGRGCADCAGSGYRGRIGIFEVLPVTGALRSLLMTAPNEATVRAASRATGMTTLRGAGLAAAHRGVTTYEEVLRVTQVEVIGETCCPGCGRAVADDMLACPWCAVAIERGNCPTCARMLEPDWALCPWCLTTTVEEPLAGPTWAHG